MENSTMKRLVTLTIALGLALSLPGFVIAHGGAHKTLMGTVHTVVETEIVVITVDGGQRPVAVRPSTRYLTARDEIGSWEELGEGMRVSIKLDVKGQAADEVRYRAEPASVPDGESDDE
jgi:hypothetical protein